MKIEINNLAKKAVFNHSTDKKIFSTVAKIVLKGENKETKNLSVAFVAENEIKKINRNFRNKNKATDVLSFELSAKAGPAFNGKEDVWGEIVICPAVVKKNAQKYKVSFRSEMIKIFIHGLLHLCGYDHEKSIKEAEKMNKKQEEYLDKVNSVK